MQSVPIPIPIPIIIRVLFSILLIHRSCVINNLLLQSGFGPLI